MLTLQEDIVLIYNEHLATVILNRPNKGNLLTPRMIETLLEFLPKIAADINIRALVITGSGHVFCTGLDLSDDTWSSNESITQRMTWLSDKGSVLIEMVTKFPKPVFTRINGPAIGVGVGLVLASDIRLAVETAYFSFFEGKLGFIPSFIPLSAVSQISKHRASDYILTGRHVSADEAVESFINGVMSSQDELDAQLNGYIELIVNYARPSTTTDIKELIDMLACGGGKEHQSQLNSMIWTINNKVIQQEQDQVVVDELKLFIEEKGHPDCSQE